MYWNITDKERLVKAFTFTNTPKLAEKFLQDLLTQKEIKMCVARLKALCMLHDAATYKQIELNTGLSSKTIARLAKIADNNESGFHAILRKFKKEGPAYFD